MREHGVLRRILLIYQEWIGRLRSKGYEQLDTLVESKRIIRSFVEDCHEKLKEEHLFPRFKKVGKLIKRLVPSVVLLACLVSTGLAAERSFATPLQTKEPPAPALQEPATTPLAAAPRRVPCSAS